MCGEYDRAWHPYAKQWELPPRARRILCPLPVATPRLGTTSAYAENTSTPTSTKSQQWNYLRVRGEYPPWLRDTCKNQELPPRTRRIPKPHLGIPKQYGTTSAYAENTRLQNMPPIIIRNYLRVRGEYVLYSGQAIGEAELPPRTRRIQGCCARPPQKEGTTSAYAENTARLFLSSG